MSLGSQAIRLLSDIDKLDLSTLSSRRPHIPLRRDGDGRLAKEVGDIIALLQYADEHQLIASLPKYVASSPDTMPSIRLYGLWSKRRQTITATSQNGDTAV